MYDEDFVTLSDEEFARSAQPLIDKYRATFGKRREIVADARRELEAHCNAWAINKKRRAFADELLYQATIPEER